MTVFRQIQEETCAPATQAPSAFARLGGAAMAALGRYRPWRETRATERALMAMPAAMRKDFGWPAPPELTLQDARATARRPAKD